MTGEPSATNADSGLTLNAFTNFGPYKRPRRSAIPLLVSATAANARDPLGIPAAAVALRCIPQ